MDYKPCTFRVSAKAIITNHDGLLLVKEDSERWDLPGGGIEHHETPEIALAREVKEELGVKVDKIHSTKLRAWTMYDLRANRPLLFLVYPVNVKSYPRKSSVKNIQISYFTENDLESIDIEEHLEQYRQDLINFVRL